jgi:hypothetical protein
MFDYTLQARYRLKSKNEVGWSNVFSNELLVTTCAPPTGMTTVTVKSVHPTNITITWPELTDLTLNGKDIPKYY